MSDSHPTFSAFDFVVCIHPDAFTVRTGRAGESLCVFLPRGHQNSHIHLTRPSGTGWTCAKLWELVKQMHHMDCGEHKQKRKWHRNRRWRNGMAWKMREGHCYSFLDNRTTGVTDTYIKTSYLSKAALSSSTQTVGQKCTLNCNMHKRKMRFMYICPTFYIQLCFELYILFRISSSSV